MTALLDKVRTLKALPTPAMRRAIRQSAGVSQADLALELGVTQRTVSRWESGERLPRGESLARYVELLHALEQAAA